MYSTLYINKYCAQRLSEITWPQEIPLTSLEQKLTAQAMKGFDLGLCQYFAGSTTTHYSKAGCEKTEGYLYTLIQRAKQGS